MTCDLHSVCVGGRCECPSSCAHMSGLVTERVCGTDGLTYADECDLRLRSCATNTLIVVANVGGCGEMRENTKSPFK